MRTRVRALLLLFLFSFLGTRLKASLVAYIPLDNNSSDLYSGRCQLPLSNVEAILETPKTVSGNYQWTTGYIGGAINFTGPNSGRIDLGEWALASDEGISISVWVYLYQNSDDNGRIVGKESFGGGGTRYWSLLLASNDRVRFSLRIGGSDTSLYTPDNSYNQGYNQWVHLVGTYDRQQMRIYANNTLVATRNQTTGAIVENPTTNVYIGNTNGGSRIYGLVDEVRIYDHGLSEAEVEALFEQTTPTVVANPNPELTFPEGNSTSVRVFDGVTLDADVTNPVGSNSELSYLWTLVQASVDGGGCSEVGILTPNQTETPATFGNSVGTYEFGFCTTNGIGVAVGNLMVAATPSAPEIISVPTEVEVAEGARARIEVIAQAFPAPVYQWQILTLIQEVIPDSSSDEQNYTNPNTTGNETRRDGEFEYSERRELNKLIVASRNVNDKKATAWSLLDLNEEQMLSELRDLIHSYWDGDHPPTDYTIDGDKYERRQAFVLGWADLINGSNALWVSPVVTAEDDLKVVRVKVINALGEAISQNITLKVVAPIPDGPGDGDGTDSDLGIIIGSVLGGVLLCLLCCILLIILVVIILVKKGVIGGRHRKKKLKQPDFEPLIYSEYKDQLYPIPKKSKKGMEDFERLLLQEELLLARVIALLSVTNEEVIKSLVWVAQAHTAGYDLLSELISQEVAEATEEGTLFRANSVACKMFSLWVRTFGLPYLWSTLVIPIDELNENAKAKQEGREKYELLGDHSARNSTDSKGSSSKGSSSKTTTLLGVDSMEIDPTKLGEDVTNTNINTLQLWLVAEKLLKAIFGSQDQIPEEVRMILEHVRKLVREKFGKKAAYRGIGAFLFLRFICPSLLAPHLWGLLEEHPLPVAQRQLLLIAKVIQNLANGTLPGSKETFMEKLNEFITSNQAPLIEFYNKLTSSEGPTCEVDIPDTVKDNALVVLYRAVYDKMDQIEYELAQHEKGSQISQQLNDIVKSVGDSFGDA